MDSDVLFLGMGHDGGVTHYRSVLPSRLLGLPFLSQDHRGKVDFADSSLKGGEKFPVVIMQMPSWEFQFRQIIKLRNEGSIVIANIDDWIPAISRLTDGRHSFGEAIKKNHRGWFLKCLQVVDGYIASTPWLLNKLSHFDRDKPAWLCRNGLDLERYNVPDLQRDSGTVIGWSGGTGHWGAFDKISAELNDILWNHPSVQFVGVGDNVASLLDSRLGDRVHHLPWQDLWMYPRDLKMFDIALAPAEENDFYRAKSQLRLYEMGAVGACPVVAPMYDEVVDGVTGFIASESGDWYSVLNNLVIDSDIRESVAASAFDYVHSSCGIEHRRGEWEAALDGARSLYH